MSAISMDASKFDTDVLQADLPVLVDFWAEWCGPCRMVGPVVEELADELDGKVLVCKLNVDEAGEVAERYGIMSIPTLMVFVGGEEKERIVGVRNKNDLMSVLNNYIGQ
ncbi:Thioredoxin [bioreactor metagenome]|uniref:Thioredoxin n=1 Tax=bioreactor metagenome TaxID=1076179 RepID=A0A645IKF2_9ZZZZ